MKSLIAALEMVFAVLWCILCLCIIAAMLGTFLGAVVYFARIVGNF